QQHRGVGERAGPQYAAPHGRRVVAPTERVFGGVADEPRRIAEALHHLVATIDTGRAANAFVLQAATDVDSRGADLHADVAVDAVAQRLVLALDRLGARPARLAALAVVGDHQRVRVEHHALEARIRAHVLAHLLAHEAGVAIGREAVEEDPERLPRAEL